MQYLWDNVYVCCMVQMLELCANEISDLSELCIDPPQLVHLGLGFNQLICTDDYLTICFWFVQLFQWLCGGSEIL